MGREILYDVDDDFEEDKMLDGNLIAPLQNSDDFRNNLPKTFGTPYTTEEITALKRAWTPLLNEIQKSIDEKRYRPENYPSQDMTVIVSRILATFKE